MKRALKTTTATIKRDWLGLIIAGKKCYEYRDFNSFWERKLDKIGPPPFLLRLINGMQKVAPEATVLVSKVVYDFREEALRFQIDRVVKVMNWKESWTRRYDSCVLESSEPKPLTARRRRPLGRLPVGRAEFDRIRRGRPAGVVVPRDSQLERRCDEVPDVPFVVRVTHGKSAVDAIVQNAFGPFFSEDLTTLEIKGVVRAG